jgi:hypothetical protein
MSLVKRLLHTLAHIGRVLMYREKKDEDRGMVGSILLMLAGARGRREGNQDWFAVGSSNKR